MGIWDDRQGLGGDDGAGSTNGLAHYLKTTSPWVEHSKKWGFDFVQVLCYSKYLRFDATTDPLPSADCEQTSRDALKGTIYPLFSNLKSNHIVGYRVDVVAHSMGGLVARNYASQAFFYGALQTRNQGQFHEVVTLDTPELGTELARFLDTRSNCTFQHAIIFFDAKCGPALNPTVEQCFAAVGRPLAPPAMPLTTGAVYSLFPDGKALKNLKLSGPNIRGTDWRAVSSNAPFNSLLEADLNLLIAALYPSACAPGTAPLVYQILGDTNEDAIVTVPSQLAGVKPDHFHTFQGLSHTKGFFALPGFGLSNHNVLDCQDVNQLAACWLSRSGDNACLADVQDPPACVTPVSASKASPASKSAVPMPHIVTKRPRVVDRLTLRMPGGLELGKPFELVVNSGSDDRPELHVVQSSETGTQMALPTAISRVAGQTVYLSVTPKFFGNTRFQVAAAYRDGSTDTKEVAANVNLPSRPPKEFHADAFQVTGIPLDLDNPSLRLQPWAIYAGIPGRVYLDSRYVSDSIAPSAGPPVVSLDPNGVVHGLRPGTATIIGRFGSLTDQVRVEVAAKQQ